MPCANHITLINKGYISLLFNLYTTMHKFSNDSLFGAVLAGYCIDICIISGFSAGSCRYNAMRYKPILRTTRQITSLTVVYSAVYSDADQRKHQSSTSLAFVRGIHRGPVNSPHKWPVTRKMFPFDDVIMFSC